MHYSKNDKLEIGNNKLEFERIGKKESEDRNKKLDEEMVLSYECRVPNFEC